MAEGTSSLPVGWLSPDFGYSLLTVSRCSGVRARSRSTPSPMTNFASLSECTRIVGECGAIATMTNDELKQLVAANATAIAPFKV
ncbi:MAG: hypothetical protein AAF215_33450 [Cyanobacteria bacterium P01_A01_bin.123]